MHSVKCWQVDAFTDRPFGGNPAAVCWLEHEADDQWLQAVAAEMNLSETAFIRRQGESYGLRWFTPQVEVSLCGHATLASAHILWTEGLHPVERPIRFQTRSGLLTCQRGGELIWMDFPAMPAQPVETPAGLLNALGITASFLGKAKFDYLVVAENPECIRGMAPDFGKLRSVPTRGIIVTSRSDDRQFDFISRFFAPAVGIDEDPVTGSAHCCLGVYWAEVLQRPTLTAFQASARGGTVHLEVQGERVILGGQAVTVLRGQLV